MLEKPGPTPTPSGNESPLLRIRDLGVSFANGDGPRVRAVDGARMCVYPGQTLAVVGESGCGKSVTAMSVLQLIPRPPGRFDRGQILFRADAAGDADLLKLSDKQMRAVRGNQVAMIFQEPMTSLNPVYTVGDQILEAILLHQRVADREAEQIALRAMRDVGIAEPERRIRQYPHQFSGGMRQRVMIAMALACRPKLLLADEPTTALDVTVQAQILDLLRRLQHERGMALMLITHALGVVAENADVVCVMYAGRVVEYATVHELFDRPLHPYTRGLLASIPRLGQRKDRLTTIREIVDNPAEFSRLSGGALRPWWPSHERPADLTAHQGPAGEYALHEVTPGHWVGLWRTAALEGHPITEPDLSFRVPTASRQCAS
jgi:ABC-type dipeptide/oligopeptide/nickel transport system ATPase component